VEKEGIRNIMKIAVIGGGISGLASAYELTKDKHEVAVYESDADIGGLASSFDFRGEFIERYYHFICRADKHLAIFCKEIGLGKNILWREAKTGYFVNGKLYPFTTPGDLLKFEPINFNDKMRIGINLLQSKYRKNWKKLDSIPAKEWLIKQIGANAYNVMWHPLLKIKFGEYYDKISAAWIWHRLYRLSKSRKSIMSSQVLGFIDKGSKLLMDTLKAKIIQAGNKIYTNKPVKKIVIKDGVIKGIETDGGFIGFNSVISTVPLPQFRELLPKECLKDFKALDKIIYIGVVCMILKLKKPLTENFWLNINDDRMSINGIIEYSNLNPFKKFDGHSIVYIPYYLNTGEERYSCGDELLLNEYCGYLKMVNPEFNRDWILDYKVFRSPYAQPICHNNFFNDIPEHKTNIINLYIIDASQMYPTDRTLNDAIRLAKRVASLIGE